MHLTMYLSAVDVGIKMRPTEQDLKELGPEFQPRWKEFFLNAPDKPIMWMGPMSGYDFVDIARRMHH